MASTTLRGVHEFKEEVQNTLEKVDTKYAHCWEG